MCKLAIQCFDMRKLTLELEHYYTLIGIHTNKEDFRIAFILNDVLEISLNRASEDLFFDKKGVSFSMFEYFSEVQGLDFYLVANKSVNLIAKDQQLGLFQMEQSVSYTKTQYLIPEKKKVDYFLKIEGEVKSSNKEHLLSKLNSIPQIITSYCIQPNTLKSKNALIF